FRARPMKRPVFRWTAHASDNLADGEIEWDWVERTILEPDAAVLIPDIPSGSAPIAWCPSVVAASGAWYTFGTVTSAGSSPCSSIVVGGVAREDTV
ncbi:MAG TPA: hypothetical protein VF641_09570, partial [Methylobacterium sp.]